MEPHSRTPGEPLLTAAQVRLVKIGVLALGIVGLAVVAYFVVRAVREEETTTRWDEFAYLQEQFEMGPGQDPLFESVSDTYLKQRERYITALEAFLAERAVLEDDALAPQVHWLLAKVSADQVLSLKDDLDVARRAEHWERARKHLRILRDDYPDFQLNWRIFAPPQEASLTRSFLATIEANLQWEADHLPRERTVASDPVVVLRTERGDLRVGLYREQAPALADRFLERVLRGDYDGTYFFAKVDQARAEEPQQATIRAGHPAVREAPPYDREQHAGFAADEREPPRVGAPTRWLLPVTRGVLCAWHPPEDDYDGPQQFLVAVKRSPRLDYRYSPIGMLLDEESRATADRIFEGEAWRDDPSLDLGSDEDSAIADVLQVPVKIVKALVYEGGRLVEPDAPGPHRAAVDENETTLDALPPDAYRVAPPEKPAPPAEDEESPPGDVEGAPDEAQGPAAPEEGEGEEGDEE